MAAPCAEGRFYDSPPVRSPSDGPDGLSSPGPLEAVHATAVAGSRGLRDYPGRLRAVSALCGLCRKEGKNDPAATCRSEGGPKSPSSGTISAPPQGNRLGPSRAQAASAFFDFISCIFFPAWASRASSHTLLILGKISPSSSWIWLRRLSWTFLTLVSHLSPSGSSSSTSPIRSSTFSTSDWCFCRHSASFVSLPPRSEEHTSELQSHHDLVCRLLLEKKKK